MESVHPLPSFPPRVLRKKHTFPFQTPPQGAFLRARPGVQDNETLRRISTPKRVNQRPVGAGPRSPPTQITLPQPTLPPDKIEDSSLRREVTSSSSYSVETNPATVHPRYAVDGPHLEPSDRIVDIIKDDQPRRASLAPIPPHLQEPEPSNLKIDRKLSAGLRYVSPTPTEDSPSQPISPIRRLSVHDQIKLAETSEKLETAIVGLEDLVQEAVIVAEEAVNQGKLEEVREILESATNTLRRASSIPPRHLMATGLPLRISSTSESSVSSEDTDSDSSSENPLIPKDSLSSPDSWSTAPEQPYKNKPRASVAFGWAYTNSDQHRHRRVHSEGTDSPSSRRRAVFRSDELDALAPILNVHGEQIHFLSRSIPPRDSSHGCTLQRHPKHRPGRLHLYRSGGTSQARHRMRFRSSGDSANDQEDDMLPSYRTETRRDHSNELRVRDQIYLHTFGVARHHRRKPIARNWKTGKKRQAAAVACFNTALLGIIVGIYAGEVPRIQYVLADENHHVILGNLVLFFGLAISTFLLWPLPLLHGRKPYILASLAIALPLQFPQAAVVSTPRSPLDPRFKVGLLLSRALSGLVLGFANVNFFTVLLDLFGASLQSKNPHQEIVVTYDIRRHGGGMGLWLGIWSSCSIGSLAVGFQIGAGIIESKTPDWGFYVVVILLVLALLLNIETPETRRSAYRKSVTEVYDRDENLITTRVARGEIKLHMGTEGPRYWFEEVWAGIKLSIKMLAQPGFAVLALYLAWIYAQIVLLILLLSALLSRHYKWHPRYVGLGVLSIAIGALLAIPLTKANLLSRDRKTGFRTDSMTFQKRLTWSSHLVRRCIFTLALPLMGLAYTLSSAGSPDPWIVPVVFAGMIGFLSVLAMAECLGLIMETFDTCDLQPGVNTRHRLQSMAEQDKRRRTNYSSFPRVAAGIFASQTLAFILAAVATEVGGIMTRRIGAQASTGVAAGILLGLTILLIVVLWRFKNVQVIPNHTFGTRRNTKAWTEFNKLERPDWKAVVIGNPAGKMRRMSILELGGLSRWTEIRKLNFLIREERGGRERVFV